MFSGRIKKQLGAKDIGLDEGSGAHVQAAVNMAFGCEVDDYVNGVFPEGLGNVAVGCDVSMNKCVTGIVLDIRQILEVAGVGQRIQVYDRIVRMVGKDVSREITADESRAPGYEEFHAGSSIDVWMYSPTWRRCRAEWLGSACRILQLLLLRHGRFITKLRTMSVFFRLNRCRLFCWLCVLPFLVWRASAEQQAHLPVTVLADWPQARVTGIGITNSSYFGTSVALSSNRAVVGAYQHSIPVSYGGAVFVLEGAGTNWSQTAILCGGDTTNEDYFGYSVALAGDILAAGAYMDNHGTTQDVGTVYVFAKIGAGWVQQARVTPWTATAYDHFGFSVGLYQTTLVVGAEGNLGAAYVFMQSGTNWVRGVKLRGSDTQNLDAFGRAVSIDGDTILVGACMDDLTGATDGGSAYVFVRSGTNWVQQAKLTAADPAATDYFGESVSLSGDLAIIGAQNKGSYAGAAYVFTRTGTNWAQQAKLTALPYTGNDRFGSSVALHGNRAIVGAKFAGSPACAQTGKADVFSRLGTNWVRETTLYAIAGTNFDSFGCSAAVYADTVLVGANGASPFGYCSGATYFFSGRTNAPPVAANDDASTAENTPVLIPVLANDADPDGDALQVGSATTPAHGTVTIQPGSTNLLYEPTAEYYGTDTFTYVSADPYGASDTATVAVVVIKANDPPQAVDDSVETMEDTPILIHAVVNDVDVDGDPITVFSVTSPAHGAVQVSAGNTNLLYTPADNFYGADSFSYVIRDGQGGTDTGRVEVAVTACNDAPTVASDYFVLTNGVVVLRVLSNDADSENDPLQLTGVTDPVYGSVVIQPGWTNLAYESAQEFHGLDHFTYAISDGNGGVATGEVTLLVQFSSNAPAVCLQPAGGEYNDQFGRAVAIYNDRAIVGVPQDDTPAGDYAGSVEVFARVGASWVPEATLMPPDASAYDWFGSSVALFQDTAIVGCPKIDLESLSDLGAAYVYTRSGTNWNLQARFQAPGGVTNDQFGCAVALSTNLTVVGACMEYADGVGSFAGAAYVYRRLGTNWALEARLVAPDPQAGDRFGSAVALDGGTIVVGAPYHNTNGVQTIGNVHVYTAAGTSWVHKACFPGPLAPSGNPFFGWSVAVKGRTVWCGAPYRNTDYGAGAGAAYAYVGEGTNWSCQAYVCPEDGNAGDNFGYSLAASEGQVVIGARGHNMGGEDAGAAYVFVRSGSNWMQQAKLVAPDAAAADHFGHAVNLYRQTAMVGAPDDNGCGSARIFDTAMDSDRDGLPDSLEGECGCAPWQSDSDGDGVSDGNEYVAGTDPAVPTPLSGRFGVSTVLLNPPNGLTVSWSTREGRLYDIEAVDDLGADWHSTAFTNIPGTGDAIVYTNTPGGDREFLRLKVRLAP